MYFKRAVLVASVILVTMSSVTDSLNRIRTALHLVRKLRPHDSINILWITGQLRNADWNDVHMAVKLSKQFHRTIQINILYLVNCTEEFATYSYIYIMANPNPDCIRKVLPHICKSNRILYLINTGSVSTWIETFDIPINCEVYTILSENEVQETYNATSVVSHVVSTAVLKDHTPWDRRKLSGFTLRVSALLNIWKTPRKKLTKWGMLSLVMFNTLQEIMNFSYVAVPPVSGSVGVCSNDSQHKNCSGFIGMVHRNEIDLGVEYISRSFDRLDVIDISSPVLTDVHALYVRTPSQDYSWKSFTAPFSKIVWALILSVVVILPLLHYVASQIAKRRNIEDLRLDIVDSFMAVIRGLCYQGFGISPKSWSMRLLSLSVFCWGCAVMSLFTSGLTSEFSKQQVGLPFHSLADVVNSSTHTVMVFQLGVVYNAAKMAKKNTVMSKLWEQHIKNHPENEITSGNPLNFPNGPFHNMCTSPLVLFFTSKTVDALKDKSECAITRIPGRYYPISVGFAMTKGSPLLRFVNHQLWKLREFGISDYFSRNAYGSTEDLVLTAEKPQITMYHLLPVLLMYVSLAIVSCIILQIERLVKPLKNYPPDLSSYNNHRTEII